MTTLYGPNNQPLLMNRVAADPAGQKSRGVNLLQKTAALNKWREQYNPLRSLTISRAVSLLEAGQRGEFADLQWTYHFVEQTDPTLFALVERRTSALLEMDYDIKAAAQDRPDYDEKLATEQAEALRKAYDRIDNLYEAWEHLAMASFRAYAHLQPHPDPDGAVVHLEPLDQWNFVREGMYGPWYWNPEARSVTHTALRDKQINEPDFIIRVRRRHINRIGLIKFIRANLSNKDWDAFIEIYGIPARVIIGPPNVPEDKESDYRDAAEDIAEGASGYLPNGSEVHADDQVRGVQPFRPRLDWLEQQMVLVGTGGLLTMLAQSGSGTLAGGAHSETFAAIARGEAAQISELFQRWMDRRVLDTAFPGRPHLAYFQIASREERDVGDVLDHAAKANQAGYRIEQSDLEERTGYKLEPVATGAPLSDAPQPGNGITRNRRQSLVRNRMQDEVALALAASSLDSVAEAQARALKPLRDELQYILDADDEDFRAARLRNLQARLPDLLREINADPETAAVIENAMAAALVNGYAEGAATRNREGAAA